MGEVNFTQRYHSRVKAHMYSPQLYRSDSRIIQDIIIGSSENWYRCNVSRRLVYSESSPRDTSFCEDPDSKSRVIATARSIKMRTVHVLPHTEAFDSSSSHRAFLFIIFGSKREEREQFTASCEPNFVGFLTTQNDLISNTEVFESRSPFSFEPARTKLPAKAYLESSPKFKTFMNGFKFLSLKFRQFDACKDTPFKGFFNTISFLLFACITNSRAFTIRSINNTDSGSTKSHNNSGRKNYK
ncbi:hypothetical protein AVEN_271297-1 [Araneus ventricosus]|uniref:Uncharacterized protein n=1 Tax=Araneus ventricosus TaxID=182803 RepID=A0A4Y2QHG5_ARAVE|nr:hypothetical protein AVEN_271297-1 [Araneus ventricosus]